MKLLVGYGNTMRQDDGVGCWIASHLAPHYADDANVNIRQVRQLMPELAEEVARASHVIFVDASIEGEVAEVAVQPITPTNTFGDAHALYPPQILHLAQALYGQCPLAHLVTITGTNFDLGESLSPQVELAIPHALTIIKNLLHAQA